MRIHENKVRIANTNARKDKENGGIHKNAPQSGASGRALIRGKKQKIRRLGSADGLSRDRQTRCAAALLVVLEVRNDIVDGGKIRHIVLVDIAHDVHQDTEPTTFAQDVAP